MIARESPGKARIGASRLAMKLLLSVGAIVLTLTFSAYAEPPNHLAMLPDLDKCFDLLRLETLQTDRKDNSIRINANDKSQMDLLHNYLSVVNWLRGFFTAMNYARSWPYAGRNQKHHTKRMDALDIQLLPGAPNGRNRRRGNRIGKSILVKNSVNDRPWGGGMPAIADKITTLRDIRSNRPARAKIF